jgi:TolB-like protein
MSSIVPGYEYDIFISYRHNDNRSGWVTEFVAALQEELAATLKESVSVYFDTNPHDGLLETHNVDKSLEGKLKCLIFIPIISQTYCDSKSFAWQHEFVAFNKLAKEDQFGRDIRLTSGNVASRILPIKINDLDPEDKILLEKELGGVLRSIEFIYMATGVNRPLNPSDNPDKNLNKTYYRDQINKVANAVKEIIIAIKKHSQQEGEVSKEVENIKPEKPKKKNQKTKIVIASGIILALIVFGYFLIPTLSKPKEQLEKSIAVLPFRNDSPNDSTTYFLNGVMEEILNNLQKISDFSRVLSRNSVEQFRNNTTKSTPEIAKKLNVNYIVEGSGQKYGNKFVLRVQLIVADNEKHLWSKSYKQEIHETTDLINIQSQIAQSIASELKATITPEEKQLINKIPTTNLTAYDFYQQGRDEHTKYWIDNVNRAALEKAENLYQKALEYDSTFARAYIGLARVYWDKHYWDKYFSQNYMDSVLILCDIALTFDNRLAEAYTVIGNYYAVKGSKDKALNEYDKAISINPNTWEAYSGKGDLYGLDDFIKSIGNYQKAISLNQGSELPRLFKAISSAYIFAGFMEKGKYYNLEVFKLDGDSIRYLWYLGYIEWELGNFNKAIEFLEKGSAINPNNTDILEILADSYMGSGQPEESLKCYIKYIERIKALGQFTFQNMHRIGYAYWVNGYKKEAEYYFDKQIEYDNNLNKSDRPWSKLFYSYYDLAGVYAFRGDKKKAYNNLKIFNQNKSIPIWMISLIKNDHLFDSIRNELEFQQIVRDVETKYKVDHERIRKWLEEKGML